MDKSKELRVLDSKAAQNFGATIDSRGELDDHCRSSSDHVQSIEGDAGSLPRMDALVRQRQSQIRLSQATREVPADERRTENPRRVQARHQRLAVLGTVLLCGRYTTTIARTRQTSLV